jgi:site-specific DNA-methyltransferase (adenine-specific)
MKTTSNNSNQQKFIKEEILDKATIFNGDNMEILKSLPDNSIDSIVTDPPYGLSFMGKKWDHDVPSVNFWKEIFRVLKPGGHVLSFGGTRTYHRMVVNIEDAGFEIRDQIMWIYGSGFPKSHNVGEQIKKKTGNSSFEGTGTALKPANEPICVARKPISEKNIAKNVLKYGTGGLNISESKIGDDLITTQGFGDNGFVAGETFSPSVHKGRFPSNVIMSDCVGEILGEQGKFFYSPKVSKKERNLGLEDKENQKIEGRDAGQDNRNVPFKNRTVERKNIHPTVKPVDLMRYLIKLVTPKNGVVFDPFMGSGSTGIGALIEGFNFVGMEMDPGYFEIAKQRIGHSDQYKELLDSKKKTISKKEPKTPSKKIAEKENQTIQKGIWANRNLRRIA